jgi:hypothetical protein
VRSVRHYDERAPILKHDGAAGLDVIHAPARSLPEKPAEITLLCRRNEVTLVSMLPLGPDDVRVSDVGTHEALQSFVAVKAGAVLADLNEPGPHDPVRRVDRDPMHKFQGGRAHLRIARQRQVPIGIAGAPAPVPRPESDSGDDVADEQECQRLSDICGDPAFWDSCLRNRATPQQ